MTCCDYFSLSSSRILLIILLLSSLSSQCNSTHADYLTTDSELGKLVLQQSRNLNNNNKYNYNNNDADYSWMARFSLKYQGCNTIQQWNDAASGGGNDDGYGYTDNNNKIKQSKLAMFRLCPTSICSTRKSKGCTKGYGDYFVDIDTYVSAYVEAQQRQDEISCMYYMYKHCGCEDAGDDFNVCKYQCFMKAKKYDCIDENPYYDDDSNYGQGLYKNDLRDFQKYFAGCSEFQADSHRRRTTTRTLEDGGSYYDRSYYIGLYCAEQGGKIYLGMFTDDTCTTFADKNGGRTTYKAITGGLTLPFSEKSMVRTECISCHKSREHQNEYNIYLDDDSDDDQIKINNECQDVYQAAGKCETEISTRHGPASPNKNACYFIEGLQFATRDGFIDTNFTRPNQVISFFICLFSVSFVLLGAYIYYLRMSKF